MTAPTAPAADRKFDTVGALRALLTNKREPISRVMAWSNVFLEDGVYLPTTRKALLAALEDVPDDLQVRVTLEAADLSLWVN